MVIVCPWPSRQLSPNFRGHWAQKSKAAKAYREAGYWAAKLSGIKIDWDGEIHAFITFYPPDRRQRDDDNLIASFKSARDGIADALGVNDKRFRIHPFVHTERRCGGQVEVKLCKLITE
jgi:crossover junction endodeoxyribonuclease RusA